MNDDPPDLRRSRWLPLRRGSAPAAPRRPVTRELPATEPPLALPALPAEPPEPGCRVTRELPAPAPAPVPERILLILRAPPERGETAEGALGRKERELAAVLEELGPVEAAELFARLANPQRGDPVAACFARLDPARRGRLLALLFGSPRARRRPSRYWGG